MKNSAISIAAIVCSGMALGACGSNGATAQRPTTKSQTKEPQDRRKLAKRVPLQERVIDRGTFVLYQHDTQLGTERFEIRARGSNRREISTRTRLKVGDFSAWRNQRLVTDRHWRALWARASWSVEGKTWKSELRREKDELIEVTEGGEESASRVSGIGAIYLGDSSIAHFTPFCDLDVTQDAYTVFPGIEVQVRRAGWVVGEGGKGETVKFAHIQVSTPDQTLDVLCQNKELVLVLVPALDLVAVRNKIGMTSPPSEPEVPERPHAPTEPVDRH